jgi:hypothetical protein
VAFSAGPLRAPAVQISPRTLILTYIHSLMSHSRFNFSDGKICGQVPVETTSAQFLPVDNGPPPPKPQVLGPYGNDNIQIEFSGRAVYMYAAKRRTNGSRFIYRDEYFYLDTQGLSIRHRELLAVNLSGSQPNFWRAVAVGWDPNVRVFGKGEIIEVDLIFTKNLTSTFRWEFNNTNVPCVSAQPEVWTPINSFCFSSGLKYSMQVKYTRLPSWSFDVIPENPYGVFLEFLWGLKAPQSGARTPECITTTSLSGLNRNFTCDTDICAFSFRASVNQLVFEVTTLNLALSFVWPSSFLIDNNVEFIDPRSQNFKANFGPYPVNENHFSVLREAGVTLPSMIPRDQQWISFLGHLGLQPWRNELVYDPGASHAFDRDFQTFSNDFLRRRDSISAI